MRRMARPTIAPEDVHRWTGATATATVAGPEEGWRGLMLRGRVATASEVDMPPIRDHLLVLHESAPVQIRRRLHGRGWTSARLVPGTVSLLSRGTEMQARWDGVIQFAGVCLAHDELVRAGEQMYGRDVSDLELADRLDAEDPELARVLLALCREAEHRRPGTRMLVDALVAELAVHLLRRHTHLRFREVAGPGELSFHQERQVRAHVRDNLAGTLSLPELAAVASLSRFHFSRVFRRTTGLTPHEFVLQERLDLARTLLRGSGLPLTVVAARCGFADQSHMTRVFRQRVGVTPARYRTASTI
jgi:AraC family transcriptional regulator